MYIRPEDHHHDDGVSKLESFSMISKSKTTTQCEIYIIVQQRSGVLAINLPTRFVS